MKNISIEMLIFFSGIIISAEYVEQQNPNYLVPPPISPLTTRPAFHPLRVEKKRVDVITDIPEEDIDTDIEGETRVEEPKKRENYWLKCCYMCFCGSDNDD